jgi:hypothetical protein
MGKQCCPFAGLEKDKKIFDKKQAHPDPTHKTHEQPDDPRTENRHDTVDDGDARDGRVVDNDVGCHRRECPGQSWWTGLRFRETEEAVRAAGKAADDDKVPTL